MKFTKTFPVLLLSSLLLAGCGQDQLPSSLKGVYDAFAESDSLDGVKVNKYLFGSEFADQVWGSSDADYKSVAFNKKIYYPLFCWAEGLEEERYEELVQKGTEDLTYKVYDNNVVVATEAKKIYGYDKNHDADDDEAISKDPTNDFSGTATISITEDNKVAYHYIRNDNLAPEITNYNFYQETSNDDETVDAIFHAGNAGTDAYKCALDVFDQFSSYASAWDDLTPAESYEAYKKDGKLYFKFAGDLCMDLYSAERLWAWEYADDDEDYENPINKTTEEYNGIYVDRRIRFSETVVIDENGFIVEAQSVYFSYWTRLLRDPNYSAADLVPGYPLSDTLSEEELAALKARLYEPDTIPTKDGKSEKTNTYKGGVTHSNLPYEIDTITASGASNGDFDLAELPDGSGLRDNDGTDEGVWVSALELYDSQD